MSVIQLLAGTISSLMFLSGTGGMLLKAWRTKDLESYSWTQIVINNLGNLLYWVYIFSLPLGPIWVMHSAYTLASILMLVWYVQFVTLCDKQEPCF